MNQVLEIIGRHRLVPIMVIDDAAQARQVGQAVLDGGLPILEVTFRTPAAAAAVEALARRGDLLVGAGTILTVEQARQAHQAGARFLVAPGLDRRIVAYAREHDLAVLPGVATPTEITEALAMGLSAVKYFPAEPFGGAETLKAVSGPFGQVKFVPTGGIRPATLGRYLQLDCVLACGGSWMVSRELLAGRQYDRVRQLTAEAVAIVKKAGQAAGR